MFFVLCWRSSAVDMLYSREKGSANLLPIFCFQFVNGTYFSTPKSGNISHEAYYFLCVDKINIGRNAERSDLASIECMNGAEAKCTRNSWHGSSLCHRSHSVTCIYLSLNGIKKGIQFLYQYDCITCSSEMVWYTPIKQASYGVCTPHITGTSPLCNF